MGYVGNGTEALIADLATLEAETITGLYNVVTGYGAVGDGVTDDTLAIQAAVNAIIGGGILYLPPGIYKISSPIISGNTPIYILGSGQDNTSIVMTIVGQNAWNHGQVTLPLYGSSFTAEKISFKCTGAGGTALNIKLHPSSGGFLLRDVRISGLGDQTINYWTAAVNALGASLTDWTNVTVIGINGGSLNNVGGGCTFGTYTRTDLTNFGSFVYNFRGCIVNYYKAAFVFNSPTYAGIEGVTMNAMNSNGCVNFVIQNNTEYPTNTYRAAQYMFTNCQYEGYGSAFRILGASYVWIESCLMFLGAPSAVVPTGFVAQDVIYITNSYNITIKNNEIIVYSGCVVLYFVNFAAGGEGCLHARVYDNSFLLNGTATGGVFVAVGSNDIKEKSTNKFLWNGNPAFWVNNAANAAWSSTFANSKFAQIDDYGYVTYNFTTTGITDANGNVAINLPAGLFHTIDNVIAVNGDGGVTTIQPSVLWGTLGVSAFTVKFPGFNSQAVRINLIVHGY